MIQLDKEFGMKVINGCHRKSNDKFSNDILV